MTIFASVYYVFCDDCAGITTALLSCTTACVHAWSVPPLTTAALLCHGGNLGDGLGELVLTERDAALLDGDGVVDPDRGVRNGLRGSRGALNGPRIG